MGNRLLPGENLIRGDQLNSEGGSFRFILQEDGNLVLYNVENNPLWNSETSNRGGQIAILQEDGNFVIYAEGNQPVWSTGTHGNSVSNLVLQDDGNVVLYSTNGESLWNTKDVIEGWGKKLFDETVLLPDPPGASARVKVYERRVNVQLSYLGIPFDERSVTQDSPNAFHYSHYNPISKEKHKFFFAVHFDLKRLDFVYTYSVAGERITKKTKIGLVTW